ncbi:uncharacterized protein LOC131683955 isoform X2 [Topomyia yanbarensis]|uniref:uncharacterized protein LOC131683955 isoform X2 n=1 Tax=Topomyia yanbarensis TaxID=2498891 RepID=UPI00273BE584|nr:uncharacterized protein LOC131683955 isoform X2 [Topomyia yanbarensis]
MSRSQGRTNPKRNRKLRPQQQQVFIDLLDDGKIQIVSELHQSRTSTDETIIHNIYTAPVQPTLYDGTYVTAAEDTESEMSFSTESVTTETEASTSTTQEDELQEMTLEELGDPPIFSVPIIELPDEHSSSRRMETRSRPVIEGKRQSMSIVGNVRGHAVGAIIDPSSTVLMQLSKSSNCGQLGVMDCIREVNELLENDDSMVILKYPGISESQTSRRPPTDHRATSRKMLELTEDVLRRVQGSSRESLLVRLQKTLGEILYQPVDTIVVHTYSRDNFDDEEVGSEAFVGFFSKDDESALFVQSSRALSQAAASHSGSDEDEERKPIDRLRSFLENSMLNQEEIMEQTLSIDPDITVSRSGNKIIGVLSFPNASSGVVTTTTDHFSVDGDRKDITKSMKDLFKNLVQQPSEKLLVQIHSDEIRSMKVEQIKQELDRSIRSGNSEKVNSEISVRESDDKILGLMSYSGGSIVIQTYSKNWSRKQTKDNAEDLIVAIRLRIEKFIISNVLNDADLKDIASIIAQVFHSEKVDLPVEYLNRPVLGKIRSTIQQLMKPVEDENSLAIISQIQDALQDIARHEVTTNTEFNTWDLLRRYFDELICDEDSEFPENSIMIALRKALLTVLIHYESALSYALGDLLELLKTVPAEAVDLSVSSSPGTTLLTDRQPPPIPPTIERDIQSREVVQQVHNLLNEDRNREVNILPYMTLFQSLFLALMKIITGWRMKVKSFLSNEPEEARSEPLVGQKPSVSFHLVQVPDDDTTPDVSQQLKKERQHLNETIDELRKFLENSLGVPESWHRERSGSLAKSSQESTAVKDRVLTLFAKLLEETGKLKVMENSADVVHLRLESASGNLERRESDQYVMLSGSVRDQQNNLGLFFEARLVDLRESSGIESRLECVKEVRKLSDDMDQDDQQPGSSGTQRLKSFGNESWQNDSVKGIKAKSDDFMQDVNVDSHAIVPSQSIDELVEECVKVAQALSNTSANEPLRNDSAQAVKAIKDKLVDFIQSSNVDSRMIEPSHSLEKPVEERVKETQKLSNAFDNEFRQIETTKAIEAELIDGQSINAQSHGTIAKNLLDEAGKTTLSETSQDKSQNQESGVLLNSQVDNMGKTSGSDSLTKSTHSILLKLPETHDSPEDKLISESRDSCTEDTGSDAKEVLSRYLELVMHYIQESVEPMRETMKIILDKLAKVELGKVHELHSAIIQTGSSLINDYLIEVPESRETVEEDIALEIDYVDACIQCDSVESTVSSQAFAVQMEQDAQFASIECELTSIKERLQMLDEIHNMLTRSSAESQETLLNAPPFQEFEKVVGVLRPTGTVETVRQLPFEVAVLDTKKRLSDDSVTIGKREEFVSAMQCPSEQQRLSSICSEPHRQVQLERMSTATLGVRKDSPALVVDSRKALLATISTQTDGVTRRTTSAQEPPLLHCVSVQTSSTLLPALLNILETAGTLRASSPQEITKIPALKVPITIPESVYHEPSKVVDESRRDRVDPGLRERISSVVERYGISRPIDVSERPQPAGHAQVLPVPRKSLGQIDYEQIITTAPVGQLIDDVHRKKSLTPMDPVQVGIRKRTSEITTEAVERLGASRISKVVENEFQPGQTTVDIPTREHSTGEDIEPPNASEGRRMSILSKPSSFPGEAIEDRRASDTNQALLNELPPRAGMMKLTENDQPPRRSIGLKDQVSSSVRVRTLSFADDPTAPHSSARPSAAMLRVTDDSSVEQSKKRRSITDPSAENQRTVECKAKLESMLSVSSAQLSKQRPTRVKQVIRKQLSEIPVRDRDGRRRRSLCDLALSYKYGRTHENKAKSACPVEIYSCHPVGPDQLMMHWEVLPQFLYMISGYEIYVNGEQRVVCLSRTRRTALLEDIKLDKIHRIFIYPTADSSAGDFAKSWTPGIFIYHS